MSQSCEYCHALRFPQESLNCCHNGKVRLPPLSNYPDELKELILGSSVQAKNFRTNIRRYNSAFAFASFGAQTASVPGRGTYCFRIHGQIYHHTNTLHPSEGRSPEYGQLYIIEGEQAITTRMGNEANQPCRSDVMQELLAVMEDYSPYTRAYKYMHVVELEEGERANRENREPKEISLHFKRGPDRRRYNEPSHDEVAAVFVGEDGAPPAERDIIVYPRDLPPRRISYMSCNIDPMCYPLLFPRGDAGWDITMRHVEERQTATRNKITMQQFYGFRLAIKETFSPIHRAEKLFQQYAVDAYVKTEGCRLHFIRKNQSQLRVDLYSGLMDHLHGEGSPLMQPGVPVILPSSFGGSPRSMHQNYQDAMAIVGKYGKPDLFLTYTCNPKSREIVENLSNGERAEYRPDLVARVFKLHLVNLLKDIKDRHILGVPVAHVHVIEFQKRGLPHCHMLIILREEDKLRNRDDIDRLISAEIPDPEEDTELYDLVKQCMIHGPCGILNPASVCMEDGKCRKRFPKEFRDETMENLNGYPAYRRRNNGRTVNVGGVVADNRFVVPYNAQLLLKYRAHINLESCASVKSVKYLFKYVYKGHDCANLEMNVETQLGDRPMEEERPAHDEITTYLNCRYISAPEAIWRLSEYRMHEQSHTIYRLAIHLPDQQRVYFRPGEESEAADRATTRNTHLTAWFKLNTNDIEAHEYLYTEIPQHYVFVDREKKWVKRRRGGDRVISRMYSVSPTDPDKFFLRLLLLHIPGARSYDDLRTVNGELLESFRDACIQLHLLADDTEYANAMNEASQFQMPRQLRNMFATICAYCQLADPVSLWNDYEEAMTEDLSLNHPREEAVNLALHEVESILRENGTSCFALGLPTPEGVTEDSPPTPPAPNLDELNSEQRQLYIVFMQSVESALSEETPQARCFYVDAPGGSGKTYLFNKLATQLRSNGHQVGCAAWTGIAQTLLHEGRTVHTLFKLPVPVLDTSSCRVSPTSKQGQLLRNCVAFIIDEASMIPTHALHAIDRCLRDITGIQVPFGNKVILLGGDFRQVLPIVPHVPPAVVIETCIKRSHLWHHFQVHELTVNMRSRPGEQEFSRWLLELGNGNLTSDIEVDTIDIPPSMIVTGSLIEAIYQDTTTEEKCSRIILSPKNENCMQINEEVLSMIPGETTSYLSADAVKSDSEEEQNNYPSEFLNSLTPSGMPPHRLNLKVGCIVMLLRNLSLRQGLCNGSRLEVTNLHRNCIQAKLICGSNAGDQVLIPRVKLSPNDANLPFKLERTQFPIRLAYSMTINKAQGQTFERVGIFLPQPVFSHGQLYVAFSRARAMSDVYVKVMDTERQGRRRNKVVTRNVVYREVLT